MKRVGRPALCKQFSMLSGEKRRRHLINVFFLFYRKPFFKPVNFDHNFFYKMKKAFYTLSALLCSASIFAQSLNEKVIVVNSGQFEFSPPFSDNVTVGSYNPYTKQYSVFDTINSQSAQGILVDGENGYVIAENSIVKYNLKTETKTVSGTYLGASPRSLAISGNTLLVGNWYGQADSFLYAYNASTLLPLYAVKQIDQEAKSILVIGDTAYIAQNTKGTIDQCGGYGCFNDSIGSISLVQISTGTYRGNVVLGEVAAGINQLYKYGNKIVCVNTEANSISIFDIATQTATTTNLLGDVTKGIGIYNTNDLHLVYDSKAATFDLTTLQITASDLSTIANPVSIAYDPVAARYFQAKTDYSSYGSLVSNVTPSSSQDSIAVGISPENIALYYSVNEAPVALNDSFLFSYQTDTLLDVLANDTDVTFAPAKIAWISTSTVIGAVISLDSATQKIHYTPAAGLETVDEFSYSICDIAGACDTAIVYIRIVGITAITNLATEKLNAYPNPFLDIITLEGTSSTTKVEVFDMMGRFHGNYSTNENGTLNLATLSPAIYVLKVKYSNGQNAVVRVSKQ